MLCEDHAINPAQSPLDRPGESPPRDRATHEASSFSDIDQKEMGFPIDAGPVLLLIPSIVYYIIAPVGLVQSRLVDSSV